LPAELSSIFLNKLILSGKQSGWFAYDESVMDLTDWQDGNMNFVDIRGMAKCMLLAGYIIYP